MLERYNKCLPSLRRMVVSESWSAWLADQKPADRESAQEVAATVLDIQFGEQVAWLVSAVAPVVEFLREVDSACWVSNFLIRLCVITCGY